jgi:hypothetical protein
MPTVTWTGKPRRGTPPAGQYKVCRKNGFLGIGQCRGCQDCHGDGLIRVGTKKRGRRPGAGPKPRKPRKKGAVRRGLWRLGWGGAFIGLGHSKGGSIGAIVVSVLVVVWLLLTLVAWIAAPSSGSRRRRRR